LYVGGIGRSELTRQLESVCQLAGPTRQGEQRLRNFAVLRELASSAGVEFPETCDQRSIPSGQEDFVWLHKQTGSSGGLGVTRYTPGDRWPGRGTLQRWVAGRPHGATFLCRGGQARLLGVCRSLVTRVGRRHFVYAGSLGPLVLAVDTMRAVERLGQAVVEQEPLQGLFNVDVIVGQSGRVTLLEVNPRWSASSELIERGLVDRGRKPVSLLEIALEQDLEAEALPEWNGVCHLKRILYARRKLAIPAGGFNFANRTNQSIHDLPVAPAVIAAGHPVATLITRLDGSATFCAADYRRTIRELVG